jgi:hypothetical protein
MRKYRILFQGKRVEKPEFPDSGRRKSFPARYSATFLDRYYLNNKLWLFSAYKKPSQSLLGRMRVYLADLFAPLHAAIDFQQYGHRCRDSRSAAMVWSGQAMLVESAALPVLRF